MPSDRTMPDARELGRGVDQPEGWPLEFDLPHELPEVVEVDAVPDRHFEGNRLVIPLAENIDTRDVPERFRARMGLLRALALTLDALDPEVDLRTGSTHTFRRAEYMDELGHLHVGYGTVLNLATTIEALQTRAVLPERTDPGLPPSPTESITDPSGYLRSIGPGIAAPTQSAFNRVDFTFEDADR
ncbi:hypothetical protein DEJ05_00015 [Curtobacterium sp. MCLR17_045]|nr:hypothetical protein DEJ05_00015 [Curtobacterium sp. MCLR17_045]